MSLDEAKAARPEWRYLSASVIGTAHLANNLPCQDVSLVTVIPGPGRECALALVAADGAGSAEHADVGARLACAGLVDAVTSFLAGGNTLAAASRFQIESWISVVRETIRTQAEEEGHQSRDYACTLLAAVIDETGLLGMQIGDGAIVIADGAGYRPLFWPQRGEYANMTNFVTENDAETKLMTEFFAGRPDEVAVLTDGLQSIALTYATQGAHSGFFTPMFEPLRSVESPGLAQELAQKLANYLASSIVARRTDDDKTLLLATRRLSREKVLTSAEAEAIQTDREELQLTSSESTPRDDASRDPTGASTAQ